MAAISPPSPEEITELHDYFNSVADKIPMSLKLTPAETATDVPGLINACFEILSDDSVPARIKNMRVDMLRRMKAAMEKHLGE